MSEAYCVSQKRLSLKPCCKSGNSPFESRCLTTFKAMMGSIIFHKMHVREIGR